MLTIREYRKVESLDEAFELNKKKMNRIIGGMLWLKMQKGNVGTAIDLSGLGLDKIEETDTEFIIGAMVSLRALEMSGSLNIYTQNSMREALRHIVGVQFRNLATVGGSIFGRYGFSDVLTIFLALNAQVELHHAGKIPLSEFAKMPYDNDILVRIIVPKQKALQAVYLSHRMSKTDFPVITLALAKTDEMYTLAIGATPHRATIIEDSENILAGELTTAKIQNFAQFVQDTVRTDSNLRGSAQYRKHLAGVFVRRALTTILERSNNA